MKEITFEDFYKLCQTGCYHHRCERRNRVQETAQNFPLSTLADTFEQLDKKQTYHLICKSGIRSAQACQFLAEKGYDVVNVATGMDAFE